MMRLLAALAFAATTAPIPTLAQPAAPADCRPEGEVRFICGVSAPEDLILIPGSDWVVTSALRGQGGIAFVNVRERMMRTTPLTAIPEKFDRKAYPDCPGPPDAEGKAAFLSHGIALGPRRGGVQTLYAVGHEKREAIEIFELDLRGRAPALTWVGCILPPEPVYVNSLAVSPDGGFVATNFWPRGEVPAARLARLLAGEITGDLREWRPGKGWSTLPGSEGSGLNGIERSKDGKTLYVASWGRREFYRITREGGVLKRETVPLTFRIDNLRWAPDGTLITAGVTDGGTTVATIDPATLKVTEHLNRPDTPGFAFGTGAIRVGNEIWVGSSRTYRIAIIPYAK